MNIFGDLRRCLVLRVSKNKFSRCHLRNYTLFSHLNVFFSNYVMRYNSHSILFPTSCVFPPICYCFETLLLVLSISFIYLIFFFLLGNSRPVCGAFAACDSGAAVNIVVTDVAIIGLYASAVASASMFLLL